MKEEAAEAFPTVDREALAKRIRAIRGGMTLMEFGALLGVSHAAVKRYEEGALPEVGTLIKIAVAAGVDLGTLVTGKPLPADVRDSRPLRFRLTSSRSEAPYSEDEPEEGIAAGDYLSIPLTEGKIAAGTPIITDEAVIDHILLHQKVLRQTGASRNLVAARVEGESMAPHLASGDIVVIDRDVDRERIEEKKIYAIHHEGGVTAKTVQREGSLLFLIPLNQAYRIESVDLRENENPIVGKVIGAWRNFEGRVI